MAFVAEKNKNQSQETSSEIIPELVLIGSYALRAIVHMRTSKRTNKREGTELAVSHGGDGTPRWVAAAEDKDGTYMDINGERRIPYDSGKEEGFFIDKNGELWADADYISAKLKLSRGYVARLDLSGKGEPQNFALYYPPKGKQPTHYYKISEEVIDRYSTMPDVDPSDVYIENGQEYLSIDRIISDSKSDQTHQGALHYIETRLGPGDDYIFAHDSTTPKRNRIKLFSRDCNLIQEYLTNPPKTSETRLGVGISPIDKSNEKPLSFLHGRKVLPMSLKYDEKQQPTGEEIKVRTNKNMLYEKGNALDQLAELLLAYTYSDHTLIPQYA